MRQKLAHITQWLRLPAVCALCKHYDNHAMPVCKRCSDLLVRIQNPCSICALPLPNNAHSQCGLCIKQKPCFDRVYTSCCYQEPLRTLLHEFKYQTGLYLRSFLADLMMEALPAEALHADGLVPVPMHKQRLRQRGFNQAAELARQLSKKSGIPLITSSFCQKERNTSPQAGLDRSERQKNLRHAFSVTPSHYRHIVLVDDLLTTGSTANELAKTLKKQGVSRVDIWCLARTPVAHKPQ